MTSCRVFMTSYGALNIFLYLVFDLFYHIKCFLIFFTLEKNSPRANFFIFMNGCSSNFMVKILRYKVRFILFYIKFCLLLKTIRNDLFATSEVSHLIRVILD